MPPEKRKSPSDTVHPQKPVFSRAELHKFLLDKKDLKDDKYYRIFTNN
jgi:hypothetical protein